MLERGLLTERSPGGRETALSSKVAADTGLFISSGTGRGMVIGPENGPVVLRARSADRAVARRSGDRLEQQSGRGYRRFHRRTWQRTAAWPSALNRPPSPDLCLTRGLLTERSPGGRETALSSKVAADTGVFIGRGGATGMAICPENAPVVLERGLLTERSPGGRETALSMKADADPGVFIGRGAAPGMAICPENKLGGDGDLRWRQTWYPRGSRRLTRRLAVASGRRLSK